jgi:hypothetical protein
MKKDNVITGNLACTSDLCTMVEFDAQPLRDLMDDLESGWVESRAQVPKCDKDCKSCG